MNNTYTPENIIRELAHITFAQKKIIFFSFVLVFVISILIAFFWPPSYMATGSLLVKGKKVERTVGTLEKTLIRPSPVTKEDLISEVSILTSPEVLSKTAEQLIEKKIITPQKSSEKSSDELDGQAMGENISPKDKLAQKLLAALETQVVPSSRVIELKLIWSSPQKAQQILQLLMETHINYRQTIYNPIEESQFFSNQVNSYFEDLTKNETKLLALVDEYSVVDPAKEIDANMELWRNIQQKLQNLQKEQIEIGSEVSYLNKVLAAEQVQFFSFIENLSIKDIGLKLQDLAFEKTRVHNIFHPDSEQSKISDEQVQEAYQLLKFEVEAFKNKRQNRSDSLGREISLFKDKSDKLTKRNLILKKLAIKMEEIKRESRLLELSFETFYKRREEANVNQDENMAGFATHLLILSQSRAILEAHFPRKNLILLLGLFVGLLSGFTLGFLNELSDHTFKRPNEVEKIIDLPVIFSIPER